MVNLLSMQPLKCSMKQVYKMIWKENGIAKIYNSVQRSMICGKV